MCERSYETYDSNQYFIKFLRIHPSLRYLNNKLSNKKLQLQEMLIIKFNSNELTKKEIIDIYQEIIDIELQAKIHLGNVEAAFRKTLNIIKKDKINTLVDNLSNVINKLDKSK